MCVYMMRKTNGWYALNEIDRCQQIERDRVASNKEKIPDANRHLNIIKLKKIFAKLDQSRSNPNESLHYVIRSNVNKLTCLRPEHYPMRYIGI